MGVIRGTTDNRDNVPDFMINLESGEGIRGALGRADDVIYRYMLFGSLAHSRHRVLSPFISQMYCCRLGLCVHVFHTRHVLCDMSGLKQGRGMGSFCGQLAINSKACEAGLPSLWRPAHFVVAKATYVCLCDQGGCLILCLSVLFSAPYMQVVCRRDIVL